MMPACFSPMSLLCHALFIFRLVPQLFTLLLPFICSPGDWLAVCASFHTDLYIYTCIRIYTESYLYIVVYVYQVYIYTSICIKYYVYEYRHSANSAYAEWGSGSLSSGWASVLPAVTAPRACLLLGTQLHGCDAFYSKYLAGALRVS
jgi:hypothetical protein